MTEQEFVKRCLGDICRKAGFGDPHAMTQRNFEMLSDEIRSKTDILLSVSTLKRLLNGNFSRMPQSTTLNTISSYLGFGSWQEYKDSVPAPGPAGVSEVQPDRASMSVSFISWKRIAGSFFVVAIVVFLGFTRRSSDRGYERAVFSATKTTSNDIPNTVVFNYDVTHVNADSFFIQQSWDINRRVRVDKNRHTLTDIYYEPGYHLARLLAGDSVIRTMGVSIPTDKWIFYAKQKLAGHLPEYISVPPSGTGSLRISKSDAENSLVDVTKEHVYIMAYFPSRFWGSADNFILTCRVRVTDVRNNACPHLMCEIYSQNRFMFFKSMPKGCAHAMLANFGNVTLNGANSDLSDLAMDVREWQDIEFTVRDKKVRIKINGVDKFSTQYKVSPGQITGLGFLSNGLCEVDFIKLTTIDGEMLYREDF